MTNVKWVVRDTVYKEMKNKTILIVFILNIIILLASSFGIDFIFDYVSSGTELNFNNEKIGMFKFFLLTFGQVFFVYYLELVQFEVMKRREFSVRY